MAGDSTLAERIAAVRTELAALEREQRQEQLTVLAHAVGDHAFSAKELIGHAAVQPALAALLADLPQRRWEVHFPPPTKKEMADAISHSPSPKQVGHWLRALETVSQRSQVRLVRLPRNGDGAIWAIEYIDGVAGDS